MCSLQLNYKSGAASGTTTKTTKRDEIFMRHERKNSCSSMDETLHI